MEKMKNLFKTERQRLFPSENEPSTSKSCNFNKKKFTNNFVPPEDYQLDESSPIKKPDEKKIETDQTSYQLWYIQDKLIKLLQQHKSSGPFLELTIETLTSAVVSNINDLVYLNVISERLDNKFYETARHCIADFDKMFMNIYLWSEPNDDVITKAKDLQEFFHRMIASMRWNMDNRESFILNLKNESPCIYLSPLVLPGRETNQLKNLQDIVMKKLCKHEFSFILLLQRPRESDQQTSVSSAQSGSKKQIITLGGIQERLKKNCYWSARHCIEDIDALFMDFHIYNFAGVGSAKRIEVLQEYFHMQIVHMPKIETEIEAVAPAEQISDDPQPGPSRSSDCTNVEG